jgi:hypothetical protein
MKRMRQGRVRGGQSWKAASVSLDDKSGEIDEWIRMSEPTVAMGSFSNWCEAFIEKMRQDENERGVSVSTNDVHLVDRRDERMCEITNEMVAKNNVRASDHEVRTGWLDRFVWIYVT